MPQHLLARALRGHQDGGRVPPAHLLRRAAINLRQRDEFQARRCPRQAPCRSEITRPILECIAAAHLDLDDWPRCSRAAAARGQQRGWADEGLLPPPRTRASSAAEAF